MQQQKLCLKWHNHSVNFLSEFQDYRQKDILVDVTITCEGRNIKAHKMILSACSPYFQNIFSENPCQHPIVIINGMKYEDIMSILSFMYKGEVNVSHEGLSSFLQAAEALKVKGLAEVCGEKKSATSNQEKEVVEPTRPPRTETPNKKRQRNRKRSFSDDEGGPVRKSREPQSPEIHELSGDESYAPEERSSSKQQMNSRRSQNMHSRSHPSSNVTSHEEDMDDDYEIEPSKLLEQTLTTENVSVNNSTDNSLRIDRITGNTIEVEPTSIQEPESPPDIKPVVDYGESSTGASEGNTIVFNEQSQPGPSNIQEMRDSSPTQVSGHTVKKRVKLQKKKEKSISMSIKLSKKEFGQKKKHQDEEMDTLSSEELLKRSKQLLIFNEEGCMKAFQVNKEVAHNDEPDPFEFPPNLEVLMSDSKGCKSSDDQPDDQPPDLTLDCNLNGATPCLNSDESNNCKSEDECTCGQDYEENYDSTSEHDYEEKYISEAVQCFKLPEKEVNLCSTPLPVQPSSEIELNSPPGRSHRNVKNKSARELLMMKPRIGTAKKVSPGLKGRKEKFSKPKDFTQCPTSSYRNEKKSPKKGDESIEKYGPDKLPPGWRAMAVKRLSGKTAGSLDVYMIAPDGKRLRSKNELANYIQENKLPFNADEFIFRKSAYSEQMKNV